MALLVGDAGDDNHHGDRLRIHCDRHADGERVNVPGHHAPISLRTAQMHGKRHDFPLPLPPRAAQPSPVKNPR
jgi:hypothetical protein